MDSAQLAQAASTVILPWLAQTGAKALDKMQGSAVDTIAGAPAQVYAWVKDKLGADKVALAVLEELPAKPDDADNQKLLESKLAKLLESNEALRTELAALLPPAPAGAQTLAGQTATQSGIGNITNQIAGQDNSITFGKP